MCILFNPCSLQNKFDHFGAILEDRDIDFAAIVESWMPSQQNNITAELRDKGYGIYHFNRDHRKGGGVALIYKSHFKFIQGRTFKSEYFECIHVSIACRTTQPVNFIVVYRYSEVTPSYFLDEFYPIMENIFMNFKNVIFLGDFNLHVNERLDPNIVKFYDILSSFNLTQEIDGPTHKLGNTLDLVIHDTCDTKVSDICIDFNSRSDHAQIFFKLALDILTINQDKTVTFKDFKNVNIQDFKSDISSKVQHFISNTDRSFANTVSDFNSLCNICVDSHVSTKVVRIHNTPRPKWMDSEFIKTRAERRKLYKKWKRTCSDIDRCNFENARNVTGEMALDKRSNFYKTSIENCNNSHKELFKVCKNLLDKSQSNKLPTYTSSVSMAEEFNDYFISKIETIRSSFPKNVDSIYGNDMDTYNGPFLEEFRPVSMEELQKIIKGKPIKTSPQDPLPAVLFKACMDELLPALTSLVNLSLSSSSMDGLKDTVISPLLKKAGLDPEVLKNYRPVFNVLYLSKIIERAALNQCDEHINRIDAHIPNQSGYKPLHSCETLLLRITNDIVLNLDKSKCVIMLLLDLTAAFDTVDHKVLLDILWYELGFRGKVYKWFDAFLKDRRQAIGVDGHKSSFRENLYGVPQGSVVGPFLFNIYVRLLFKTMTQAGFTIHGYADDHQILYSFEIDFQVAVIRKTVPCGLDIISKWMERHFLKLNPSKTQVIIFHPESLEKQLLFGRLLLSDCSYIPISSEAYNLGVTFNSTLTFSPHITTVISQGYHLLRNIAGIRKYLSTDHLKTLVNAVVVAKADNCNALLYGISVYDAARLQRFQNSCARMIYCKRKNDHVTGILKELHWLPSEARTYFKLLCYVYKCLHDLAPSYLSELISIRRHNDLSLMVPRCLSKIGDRAFSVAGPRLWNGLPVPLRLTSTLGMFKSQLKHLLFSSFHTYKLKINIYRS